MQKLKFFADWPSPAWTRVLLIVGLILAVFFNVWLGILFTETQYPVSLFERDTTFSGPELRSHHAVLLDQGTIGTYRMIQYLDYGLMFFTGLFFFILALYIARKHKDDSWRRFGFIGALLFPASALMDAIENGFLLIMLSDPPGFPDWLAMAFSSFASAKWALFIIGMVWLILTAIALVA